MSHTDRPLTLAEIQTPALVLDRDQMRRNIALMAQAIGRSGARLRPHVKTHKSVDVWHDVCAAGGTGGITVSTLAEAEHFFAHGADDILYAVGIVPAKIARAARLLKAGARLTLVVDDADQARAIAAAAQAEAVVLPVMIEIDVDGHRAGIRPDSAALITLATLIASDPALHLAGVMTHAGGSYGSSTAAARLAAAQQEASGCVRAASRIRAAGIACETVSIGSTPTALAQADLAGVTEVRAGVYTFFDLVMAGLGVAEPGQIALSVLATVIGHQAEKGVLITDAGWMALSRDRGTASQAVDQGYGLVCDVMGSPLGDVIVQECNQEHGIIGARAPGARLALDRFPIGSQLRILPNHACATAAQHAHYMVLEQNEVIGQWPRIGGW
jgi:D-serine deaminase-like pyridoxal phosphate-dependent protein